MSVFPSSLLFILGLVFGSFFSAFTFRYPREIQFTSGRSFCPNCKKKIEWFDNIPLLSFFLLWGKCRNCRKPISWRYPLIELITAVGFLLIGWNMYWLVIFSVLFLIFIIDMEHQIIPDDLVFLGLAFSLLAGSYAPMTGLFAGFTAAAFLVLIHLATRGRGMGLGDVKLAVWAGFLTGLKLMPVWLFIAFLTGGAAGVILILAGKAKFKSKIAFGPFLITAVPIALIWGEKILDLLWLS